MNIILAHPTANMNSRHAAQALIERGQNTRMLTAFVPKTPRWMRSLPAIGKEFSRREMPGVVQECIRSVAPFRELARLASGRGFLPKKLSKPGGWACLDYVYRTVDEAAARIVRTTRSIDSVYCYEDSALQTFEAAAETGARRLYELPIGYWKRHAQIWKEETELNSIWAATWSNPEPRHKEWKLRQKDAELINADHVIVPSGFVADTLKDFSFSLPPISIVPYGCPAPVNAASRRWYTNGKLRVLFVGKLSQRKGLSYLVEAIGPYRKWVEIAVIGSGGASELLKDKCNLLGIRTHAEVLEAMAQSDVFIFPTLFEGYSLAVAEALSQGLPVITTRNSGADGIITDGKDGWMVPIRDTAYIGEHIAEMLSRPTLVREMGHEALATARRHSWHAYRENLAQTIIT